MNTITKIKKTPHTAFFCFLLCLFFNHSGIYSQNQSGTCSNPIILNDSIFTLNLQELNNDRTWFAFKTNNNFLIIQITDASGKHLNHLIFKHSGNNFCESISKKELTPERNKVCDALIDYDASTSLSYENIHRGVCKCAGCCPSVDKFITLPNEWYYIVVYDATTQINIRFFSNQAEVMSKEKAPEKVDVTANNKLDIKTIEVGQNITLQNIYFEPGMDVFLRKSYEALDELFAFMKNNPAVKIEIQGHVNGPNQPMDIAYSNNLGYKRARAVYEYLVSRKIDKDRMTYKGFGNTQMIFPNATSELQMARNRRVEIMILSK